MHNSKFPSVSITFPNYNGGKEPIDCLRSIRRLNYPKDKLIIIVVDNGSTDGSIEQIEKKIPNVVLIKNRQNVGFAKAINQALKIAKSDYIFITNDDITFEKNSLKNLINYSLKNSGIGILGGLVYKKHPKTEISTAGNNINTLTGKVYSSPRPKKIKEPNWIPGCAMLVKKAVVQKIGLLDDLFFFSFEDFDYCLRAQKSGFRVVYYPRAVFWHTVSATANKNRKLTHFQWYQSKIRFALKNLPLLNFISILIFQTLAIPLEAILKRDHRIIPYTQALIWNIKNFPNTIKSRKLVKIW